MDRYAQLNLDVAHLAQLYARFADQVKRGEPLGADVSILKIFATATYQRITELTVEAAGEQGALLGPAAYGNESVDPLAMFYLARPATIYGGSSEIQRGIVAKAVLGLPEG